MSQVPPMGYKRHPLPLISTVAPLPKLGGTKGTTHPGKKNKKGVNDDPTAAYLAKELQRIENTLDINGQRTDALTTTIENGSVVNTQSFADLESTVNGNTAAITSEALTRASADSSLSTLVTNLTATVSTNDSTQSAAITTEQTARANADTAIAQDITDLTATVSTNDSTQSAAITTEQTARANADTAIAQDITDLTATVSTNDSNQSAAITTEQTARANAVSAVATDLTTLEATVTSNNSTLSSSITTEATTRSNADTTLANDITTLSSTVDGVSASVTTEASTRASADSALEAKYGVKLDVNGYVTGFEQNNDGTSGSFKILADEFLLIDPSGGANQSGLAAFTYSNNVVSLGSGVKLTADSIETGTLSADRISLDGSYLSVTNGELTVTGAPGMPAAVEVDDTTGNTDASVTVTRVANGTVLIGINWKLSKAWPSTSNETTDPFPVTLTLKRGSTTIKTWTADGTFIQGNNSAGEPYVSFGNFSTQWYDSDTGSGSTTYTLTVSNRSTSYFDLETQLSAQPST